MYMYYQFETELDLIDLRYVFILLVDISKFSFDKLFDNK